MLPRRLQTRPAVVPRLHIVVAVKRTVVNRPTSRRVKQKNINVLAIVAVTMMMTKMIATHNIRVDRVALNEVAIPVDEDPIHVTPETMNEIENIRTNREIAPGQDRVIGTNRPKGDREVDLAPRQGEDIRPVSRSG